MEAFQFGEIGSAWKGNHSGEAYVKRGRRKDLYRREGFLKRIPHEEAEIQHKALRPERNLAFSEDTCLQKKSVRSKVTPRKVGVGLKRRREPSMSGLGWSLGLWGSTEKKKASHLHGFGGRHQYSDQRSNRNRVSCGDRGGVGPNGQIVSLKRAADGRRQRNREINDKSTRPRTDSCGTPQQTQ